MNSYCNMNPDISYDAAENADLEPTYYMMFKKYVMPYLDHCYATGLPTAQFETHSDTLPLPLTEPLAAFVDIEEVAMRGGLSIAVPAPTGKRGGSSSAKHSGHNSSNIGSNSGGDAEVDPYEGSVTRCICDFQHDDGYMICCDRCGVWQHVECMGVDGKHIPDSYLCELCYPRLVDKRRAVRIQSKKKEELETEEMSVSADDSLEEESKRPKRRVGRRREQGRRKSTTERSDSGGGNRKSHQQRRKRTSSEMDGKKHSDGAFNLSKGLEQKRLRPQSFAGFNVENSDMWDMNPSLDRVSQGVDVQQFGTNMTGGATLIQPNTYSAEVLNLLVMKVKTMGASNSSNLVAITQQLSRKCFKVVTYEGNSKGLEAIETTKPNHTVAEYTGKTVMRREYERSCQSDLSYPFTVCYMGINGVELCVDSTDFNNEAKYIRRSCTPNAKVVHLLEKTGLRFFVCATKTILCGKEITIPFYFDYQRSSVEVKCPCGRSNCMVAKHFKKVTGRLSTSGTTAFAATPASTASSTSSIAPQRPVRQSKKRALDEFADSRDEEEEEEECGQASASDRCSTGRQSPTKKRNFGEQPGDHQQETRATMTSSGRVVKPPRGRETTLHANNGSDKGSLASMLQAHLARNVDLSKASLAPMGANVSDDIALLNKLSSAQALHLVTSTAERLEGMEAAGILKDSDSKEESQSSQRSSSEEKSDGKDAPRQVSCGTSRRKQQLSQSREVKTESETKNLEGSSPGSAEVKESNVGINKQSKDNAAPKEKRKNSKLLAEIQTFLKSDGSDDDGDPGERKVSTREQRKIEAAERRFEKIEKNSAKSYPRAPAAEIASKSMKTRSGQQEEKDKKLPDIQVQKPGQRGTHSRANKPTSGKAATGKSQKSEEPTNKATTRQQSDKKSTADAKKLKATTVPLRTTRSSGK